MDTMAHETVTAAHDLLMACMTTQLRPVSYKWLAREMNISSNEAKRHVNKIHT